MKVFVWVFFGIWVTIASAGVYKWTDANGRVHYLDKPVKAIKAESVKTRSSVSAQDSAAAKQR